MEELLMGLNEEQQEAVMNTEGFVRVIAGAGSGKTRTLTYRYAYLVNELGISTANILCATFTNKAASEMKKRIRQLIGDSDTGFVCTFHGFCVQLLREDIHVLQYPKGFVVMDTEDTESILKKVYLDCGYQNRNYTFTMARDDISDRKDRNEHIPYFVDLSVEKLQEEYQSEQEMKRKVFLGYLYEQKKCFGLDYDDLIILGLYVLENYPDKRQKWQQRMMYVMVDEFQDMSDQQYRLASILSRYHKNFFVVGDPDQTIYSWRGAKIEHIINFPKVHHGTKTIFLNRNYRSRSEILQVSNTLISHNKNRVDKQLESVKGEGVKPLYFHGKTTREEALWMTGMMQELKEQGVSYSNMAVLYRSHYVSRSIEEILISEKIPYVLYSGVEFYKRKEIKDILSYMRLIMNGDDLSFRRIANEPKRNIGRRRMAFLEEYATENKCSLYTALKANLEDGLFSNTKAEEFVEMIDKYSCIYKELEVSDLLTRIMSESGYEAMLRLAGEQERLDNLSELKLAVFEFEKNSGEENALEDYLQNVALFTNADKEESREAVKLMTIHTAKGLEFPYVFVAGMNEGIFPTSHVNTREKLEEERRLAYVAFTRAEEGLFISDAEGTNYDGSYRYPSRFIFNIGEEHLEYVVELSEHLRDEASQFIHGREGKVENHSQFKAGDKVRHKIFGVGEIIAVKDDMEAYVIQFQGTATERNLSFRAPLSKVE